MVNVIGRNIVWLVLNQLSTWAIALIVLIVVPDILDPAGFGVLNFALSYVAFFALVAGLGTSMYLVKEVARDHSIVGPWTYNAVVMKIVSVAVLSVVALVLAVALGNHGETLLLIAICCAGMLFSVVTEVLASALGGMERMVRAAIWLTVQVYFSAGVGILVVLLGWGVTAYAIVLAVATAIPMTACAIALWPLMRDHLHLDLRIWRRLIIGGAPLLVLASFNMVYGTVDVPILKGISGDEAVGWYSVAYRWAGMPIFIASAVVAAFFPQFSSEGATMSERFPRLVNRAVNLVLLVSIPGAVGIWLIAPSLIRDFYQPDYENSIVLLRILAIHVPLAAMDTVLATALIAADRLKRYVIVAGIAAVITVPAFVIAIKITEDRYDNGAIGASIVTVATEVFIMVGALVLRPKGVLDGPAIAANLRIVAAAAAMIPVLLLAGSLPLAIQIILGAVTYAAAALLFRAITLGDVRRILEQVLGAVSRRPTPAVVGMPHPDLEAEVAAEVTAEAEVEAEVEAEARASARAAAAADDDSPRSEYGDH
jgi:O-antigen/teichoic acid export membrane protein